MNDLLKFFDYILQDWKHFLGTLAIIILTTSCISSIVPKEININIFKRKE